MVIYHSRLADLGAEFDEDRAETLDPITKFFDDSFHQIVDIVKI